MPKFYPKNFVMTDFSKALSGRILHYHTAGFVCEVLICENYASCHRLANFNSAVTLAHLLQLTAHVTVPCLLFLYPISLFKCYKRVDISASAWPKRSKDRGGCVYHDNLADKNLLYCFVMVIQLFRLNCD